MKKLATINKTIVVLGNHDIEYRTKKENKYKENEYFISSLKKIKNLDLLRNEIYKDKNITFVGCEIEYEHYTNKTIDTIDTIFSKNMIKNFCQFFNIHFT